LLHLYVGLAKIVPKGHIKETQREQDYAHKSLGIEPVQLYRKSPHPPPDLVGVLPYVIRLISAWKANKHQRLRCQLPLG
jgi:hypothetical protein